MNDPTETISAYERYREARSKLNASIKETVFVALAAEDITEVRVEFDGEGDSGQIHSITGYSGEKLIKLPSINVTIQRISYGDQKPYSTECSLTECIEELCYSYLEDEHDGWENNEGAYGEFCLDVATRSIELEFNGRITDIFAETHTF